MRKESLLIACAVVCPGIIATHDAAAAQDRSAGAERYPGLAAALGFTPAESEVLVDLLYKHEQEASKRFPSSKDRYASQESILAAVELATRQKEELEARLGSRYFLVDSRVAAEARQALSGMNRALPVELALSESQAKALLATLLVESRRLEVTADRKAGARNVIESARAYLNARQLAWIESTMNQTR